MEDNTRLCEAMLRAGGPFRACADVLRRGDADLVYYGYLGSNEHLVCVCVCGDDRSSRYGAASMLTAKRAAPRALVSSQLALVLAVSVLFTFPRTHTRAHTHTHARARTRLHTYALQDTVYADTVAPALASSQLALVLAVSVLPARTHARTHTYMRTYTPYT